MRHLIPSFVRIPVIFFIIFGLIEYFIDSGEKPAFIEYPVINLFLLLGITNTYCYGSNHYSSGKCNAFQKLE